MTKNSINLDHDSKQHRTLGYMVVQCSLGVKELLVNNFVVSNILDHLVRRIVYSEVLVHRHGHDLSPHLVHTAHTNYEQGVVRPIRGKKGRLHAFNMIQLQHGHPLHQGHQFSKIILFYRTMHLLQSGQDGLSHSEPHEFVLVSATPTRSMLPPRKFSDNIEHVDRASASQLAATPVGCQGSTETHPEHLKNGFNKTNPYLDMKEGQPVSHQHKPPNHGQVIQPEFTAGNRRPEHNGVVSLH